MLYKQVGGRLAVMVDIEKRDIAAHGLCHFQNTVSGRIDPHIADQDFRAGDKQSGGDKIGGGRDVAGNTYFLAVQSRIRGDGGGGAFGLQVGSEILKHDLRMVAADDGFRHSCYVVRIQAGQQDGGLDLGRGYFGMIMDAVQRRALDAQRRTVVAP